MSSIFSQPSTSQSNPFGSLNTNTTTNPFGSPNTNTNTNSGTTNIFGLPTTSTSSTASTQATSGKSLFDRITPATQSSTSSIFGGTLGAQGNNTQAPASNSIFGTTLGAQGSNTQAPASNTLFGSTLGAQGTQPQSSQPGSSIFGGSTLLGGNSNTQSGFGGLGQSTTQQNQQPTSSLFGGLGQNTNQQTQTQGTSVFGSLGQNVQQQQQAPQQPMPYGTKTVTDQMEAVLLKWHPYTANTLFQTYLYNSINPDQAPFYGPGATDDESKWEEALRTRPNAATVPTSIRGFRELGLRAVGQRQALDVLHGRLHEIVEGLTAILRKHDLDISTRAVEARRRHLRLSNKCLTLAAKAQLLKNRGYALDGQEEELRKKLLLIERKAFDPALNGRGEEIWARMVSVRERGRQLEREFERAGKTMEQNQTKEIDESVFVRCRQILEGYSSQIQHLAKEMEQLKKEFAEWELSRRP